VHRCLTSRSLASLVAVAALLVSCGRDDAVKPTPTLKPQFGRIVVAVDSAATCFDSLQVRLDYGTPVTLLRSQTLDLDSVAVGGHWLGFKCFGPSACDATTGWEECPWPITEGTTLSFSYTTCASYRACL
jgi:hypothetical protein